MTTPAYSSTPNSKNNPPPCQNLYQILVLAAGNEFDEVLVDKLKELYRVITMADDSLKPLGRNMGTNGVDTKNFFMELIKDGKVNGDHPFFNQQKPSFGLLVDPITLLKRNVQQDGYPYVPTKNKPVKTDAKAFNIDMGDKNRNRTGSRGRGEGLSKEQIKNLNVPKNTKAVLNNYSEAVKNISASEDEADDEIDVNGGSIDDFKNKFLDLFNEFKNSNNKRINTLESNMKQAKKLAEGINDQLSDIKKAADTLENNLKVEIAGAKNTAENAQLSLDTEVKKIDNAQMRLDNQANDIAEIKNDIKKGLTVVKVELSEYEILQFYEKARFNKNDYWNAILACQKAGRFGIDINVRKNGLYLVKEGENVSLNCYAVEEQLGLMIHITDVKLINRKDDHYTAYFTLDCQYNRRRGIGDNLIKNRKNNVGHFGLRLDTPLRYNIDNWLKHAKTKVVDHVSGKPVLHDFDRTKQGAYVVYVNDYKENGWNDTLVDGRGHPAEPRDYCSRIFPWNPLDFMAIKKENFTLANMKKLADSKKYFTYDGHVMEIPDCVKPEASKSKVVVSASSTSSWNFGKA